MSRLVEGGDGEWFGQRVQHKLGDGKEAPFWEGRWAGDQPLKVRFPRLF